MCPTYWRHKTAINNTNSSLVLLVSLLPVLCFAELNVEICHYVLAKIIPFERLTLSLRKWMMVLSRWTKSYTMTIKMKCLWHYFHTILFFFQYFTKYNIRYSWTSHKQALKMWIFSGNLQRVFTFENWTTGRVWRKWVL